MHLCTLRTVALRIPQALLPASTPKRNTACLPRHRQYLFRFLQNLRAPWKVNPFFCHFNCYHLFLPLSKTERLGTSRIPQYFHTKDIQNISLHFYLENLLSLLCILLPQIHCVFLFLFQNTDSTSFLPFYTSPCLSKSVSIIMHSCAVFSPYLSVSKCSILTFGRRRYSFVISIAFVTSRHTHAK